MGSLTERVDPVQVGRAENEYLAAALAFISQISHLWMLPEAFVITLLPGVFFFTVAVGQGLLGVRLLFDLGRWTRRLGIVVNVLLPLIWILTRIVPLAPLTGSTRLPVEPLGIIATVAEFTLVGLLLRVR